MVHPLARIALLPDVHGGMPKEAVAALYGRSTADEEERKLTLSGTSYNAVRLWESYINPLTKEKDEQDYVGGDTLEVDPETGRVIAASKWDFNGIPKNFDVFGGLLGYNPFVVFALGLAHGYEMPSITAATIINEAKSMFPSLGEKHLDAFFEIAVKQAQPNSHSTRGNVPQDGGYSSNREMLRINRFADYIALRDMRANPASKSYYDLLERLGFSNVASSPGVTAGNDVDAVMYHWLYDDALRGRI